MRHSEQSSTSHWSCNNIFSWMLNCVSQWFNIDKENQDPDKLIIDKIYNSSSLPLCLIKIVLEYSREPKTEGNTSITSYYSVEYYNMPPSLFFKYEPYFNDKYYKQIARDEKLSYRW